MYDTKNIIDTFLILILNKIYRIIIALLFKYLIKGKENFFLIENIENYHSTRRMRYSDLNKYFGFK